MSCHSVDQTGFRIHGRISQMALVTAWAVMTCFAVPSVVAPAATLTPLDLDASAISGNGTYIVGQGVGGATTWTPSDGIQVLGIPSGFEFTSARGVSGDGKKIGGTMWKTNFSQYAGFSWTQADGFSVIPTPSFAVVNALSADGSVMVGSNAGRPLRWSPAGEQDLGIPAGAGSAEPTSVSADGQTTVGSSFVNGAWQALMWTDSLGLQVLSPRSGDTGAQAKGISGNGAIAVGWSGPASSSSQAVRWTQNGVESLGAIAGMTSSQAWAVSYDASTIVGYAKAGSGPSAIYKAMLWTPTLGMVDLNTYLPSIGVDLTGWNLRFSVGTSWDGVVIAGTGILNGQNKSWVLSGLNPAVPEIDPAATSSVAALLAAGLALHERRRFGRCAC